MGFSSAPHWTLVEDAFWAFLAAYAIALIIGLWKTTILSPANPDE